MQHKKSQSWTLLIGMVVGIVITLAGNVLASRPQETPAYRDAARIYSILQQIRQFYVDEIAYEALAEDAIKAIVKHLDRHSTYLEGRQLDHLNDVTRGEYAGVGIELSIKDGDVVIDNLFPGAPAFLAGLQMGDKIVSVNGLTLADSDAETLMMDMGGPVGSVMQLVIAREGTSEPIQFELVRQKIEVKSVVKEMINDDVGYIKITSFTQHTSTAVTAALSELMAAAPLKGLVLDLRDNPGGLLDSALEVADLFLDEGVIVKTQGRFYEANMTYHANSGDGALGVPIAVLINGKSASAAEIVAGALQANRRATVLGEQSFGKGSIQSLLPVQPGDGVLKLTTAHYFTPDGGVIDGKGITPDRIVAKEVVLESLITPIINPLPLNSVVAKQGDHRIQIAKQDYQLRTALLELASVD